MSGDDSQSTLIFKDMRPRPPVERLTDLPAEPEEGWVVYVREENAFFEFRSGAWTPRDERR